MVTERTMMAGRDSRMLFCAMVGIQPRAGGPVEAFAEVSEDP